MLPPGHLIQGGAELCAIGGTALNFGGVALHQNLTNFDADHGGTNRLTISPSSLALAGIGGG
jgi:hypothetical protein